MGPDDAMAATANHPAGRRAVLRPARPDGRPALGSCRCSRTAPPRGSSSWCPPASRASSAAARSRRGDVPRRSSAARHSAPARSRGSRDHLGLPARDRQHRDRPRRPRTSRAHDPRQPRPLDHDLAGGRAPPRPPAKYLRGQAVAQALPVGRLDRRHSARWLFASLVNERGCEGLPAARGRASYCRRHRVHAKAGVRDSPRRRSARTRRWRLTMHNATLPVGVGCFSLASGPRIGHLEPART